MNSEMTKETLCYEPLAARYNRIPEAVPISFFAETEAVLHLLSLCGPDEDPEKAYLMFSKYNIIGANGKDPLLHLIQASWKRLNRFSSSLVWHEALQEYREQKYDGVRAFAFSEEDGRLSFGRREDVYPYPFEQRRKEWENIWQEPATPLRIPAYAQSGDYRYYSSAVRNGEDRGGYVTVTIRSRSKGKAEDERREDIRTAAECATKGQRAPISISMEELLAAADEMSEIRPGDPCASVLRRNELKCVAGSRLNACRALSIKEVTNMIGMVGSGKSILIKVLAFWCHRHDTRAVIVLDTVAEVMNLYAYLSGFGIACSPLIGKSDRLKYINQVSDYGAWHLSERFSSILTPSCLIDGENDHCEEAIPWGEEPCSSLARGKKKYLCPYYDTCPGSWMQRACYQSSVVITTVAGLAQSRVGPEKELFMELVLRSFDLVMFDECDRAQKTLDEIFSPDTSFDQFTKDSDPARSAFVMEGSEKRTRQKPEKNFHLQLFDCPSALDSLVAFLGADLGFWNRKIKEETFSARTLLEDLHRKNTDCRISDMVYEELSRLLDLRMDSKKGTDRLWAAMESSKAVGTDQESFDSRYQEWVEELGTEFLRPAKKQEWKIQDSRIKLIIALAGFSHFLVRLTAAYMRGDTSIQDKSDLLEMLDSRLRAQQPYLPSALCGNNLFGLRLTDQNDIVIFRQFAFGRSLMKDLPWLRTDTEGNPAGPHVLLLSGSSYAEGAYENHVNRPVNYVLLAEEEKRDFLRKTRFFESGFPDCVSGTSLEERDSFLRIVTQKSTDLILNELGEQAGKVLLVVNSYKQARIVQDALQAELHVRHQPYRVCRLVSDSQDLPDALATIRRSEVNFFPSRDEEILVAPARAIERGHNIVDALGHSAICSVFFLVRPMPVPGNIRQRCCKLNGYIEANIKKEPGETVLAYSRRLRRAAFIWWSRANCTAFFGLAELNASEKRDVVASLFVLILQIFGRLARVGDVTRREPHVFFMDGAFRGKDEKWFDFLSELGRYLDGMMSGDAKEIAKSLYEPFYEAFRKDIPYDTEKSIG